MTLRSASYSLKYTETTPITAVRSVTSRRDRTIRGKRSSAEHWCGAAWSRPILSVAHACRHFGSSEGL